MWNGEVVNMCNSFKDIIIELNNGNGEGKKYDWDGNLEFEVECVNGEIKGKGK